MCPPILKPPPTSLRTSSLWVVTENQIWVHCFTHWSCNAHLFYTFLYTCFNAILSNYPTLGFLAQSPKVCSLRLCLLCCPTYRIIVQFSSVTQSCPTLQPHGLEHARLPWPSPTPGACSNTCPSSWWCHPIISSSVVPFSSHLQSFTASGYFPMSQFFASVAKVLKFQLQHQFFQWIFRTDFLYDWLVWFSCSPRDSQESSPTPQFRGSNSLVLSFLYSPTLISIHDDWKNHSFD